MITNDSKWVYDDRAETWLIGDVDDGCGVYYDTEIKKFNCNVVVKASHAVLFIDGMDDLDRAKDLCIKRYNELTKNI